MKSYYLRAILLAAVVSAVIIEWEVDERCLLGNRELNHRGGEFLDDVLHEEQYIDTSKDERKAMETQSVIKPLESPTNSLRGSTNATTTTTKAEEGFQFHLKMHWERGYCWQKEVRKVSCWIYSSSSSTLTHILLFYLVVPVERTKVVLGLCQSRM